MLSAGLDSIALMRSADQGTALRRHRPLAVVQPALGLPVAKRASAWDTNRWAISVTGGDPPLSALSITDAPATNYRLGQTDNLVIIHYIFVALLFGVAL